MSAPHRPQRERAPKRAARRESPGCAPKIVYVSTLERGGPLTHLRALAGAMSRRGFDVEVLCTSEAIAASFRDDGVAARTVAINGLRDVGATARLWRALGGADIVHSHDRRAGLFARVVGRLRNAGVVHTLHGLPESVHVRPLGIAQTGATSTADRSGAIAAVRGGATGEAIAAMARPPLADRLRMVAEARLASLGTVVVPSRAVADWLVTRGVAAHRVEVIGHWIDVRRQSPRTRDGVLVVGVAAQLEPWKGIDILIDACAAMGQPVRLEVFGDGSQRRVLEQRAAQRRVDAHFHGEVADVRERLAGIDVLASPSRVENLPFAVLEGMAHALPVVATRVGGVPELVVDGETGLLVEPGDATALAAALDRLACAPALADAIGRAGAARASRFYNEAQILPRFLSLYRRLLDAPLAAGGSA